MSSQDDEEWGFFVELDIDTHTYPSHYYYYRGKKHSKFINLETIDEEKGNDDNDEKKNSNSTCSTCYETQTTTTLTVKTNSRGSFWYFVLRYLCFIIFILYFQTLI